MKSNRDLEKRISDLQEQLSVCYAKEAGLKEELSRYKSSVSILSDGVRAAKGLKEQNAHLTEQLSLKEKLIADKDKKITQLTEAAKASLSSSKGLKESLESAGSKVKALQESLDKVKADAAKEKQSLLENIEDIKKDSEIKTKQYSAKVKKANELVEHYKNVAKSAVDKYIDSRARMIGVTSAEIKNRLNENYSFGDIDKICESLQSYKLNVGKLPFDVSRAEKVKVTESREPIGRYINPGVDDEVDETLLRMAGLSN